MDCDRIINVADPFVSGERRQRVTGLHGVSPRIDFVETAQIADISTLWTPPFQLGRR